MRSVLTITGIGVGIATIVFLVSLGYGLQDLSVKRVASIEAVNTIDVSAGKIAVPNQAFVDKYQNDTRVEKAVVVNSVSIKGTINDKTVDGIASITPADFFNLEGLKTETGKFYTTDELKSAVVSSGLAKGMALSTTEIIDQTINLKLYVRKGNVTTATVVESQVKVTGTYTDDTTVAIYTSPDLLSATGELDINRVKLKVKNRDDLIAFKNEVQNAGYMVNSVADTVGQLDSVFRIIQIILAVFGAVALVVASIGMFNTMTIALLERTRDVGIMKATGTEDKNIYLIFLSEAVLISALGGTMGLVLGWLTAKLVNVVVNMLASSVGGESISLFVTPLGFIGLMLGFSFIVGVSTGFFPARRASKLNPLEALRYE